MKTVTETNQLQEALLQTFTEFREELAAFPESQINSSFSKGSWTPAQVARHILLATDGLPDTEISPSKRPYDSMVARFLPWWEDFTQKFSAPEVLVPDDQPQSKEKLLSEIDRVTEKLLCIIAEKDLTVICRDFELPMVGHLTRYEWLRFIEIHVRRHTHQLRNMAKNISNTGRD